MELFGRVMVGVFVFIVFTCLFYTEENWRGKRPWEACKQELIAQGVELNPDKFTPPPVPDDQNFAMTPFLAPLFDFTPKPRQPGQSPWRDVEGRERAGNFGTAFSPENEPGQNPLIRLAGQMTDLERSSRLLRQNTNSSAPSPYFSNRTDAATAVLEALEQYKPVLDELRAASHRPYSRFNVEYDAEDPMTILLPHLQVLRRASKALEVYVADNQNYLPTMFDRSATAGPLASIREAQSWVSLRVNDFAAAVKVLRQENLILDERDGTLIALAKNSGTDGVVRCLVKNDVAVYETARHEQNFEGFYFSLMKTDRAQVGTEQKLPSPPNERP